MRVYIATGFKLQNRYKEIKKELENLGHTITHDWTGAEEINKEQAQLDFKGVIDCDFLVGIFEDEYKYKGAICEVGMAIALYKPVFILGDWLDSLIFMELDNVSKIKSVNQIKV